MTLIILFAIPVGGVVLFFVYGAVRWSRRTQELNNRLRQGSGNAKTGESPRPPGTTARYREREIRDLPSPVQRYFRAVLSEDGPIITGIHMRQRGTFNMGRETEQWKPFSANQTVRPGHPGFLWDARIHMLPGLNACVHDAYLEGAGLLHGTLAGAVTVMFQENSREIAQGEFLRYLAETAWYPTALLPSQGAEWTPVDTDSARVTITDPAAVGGPLSVTMLFRFDREGRIESVYADERGAEIDGELVPTPWEGRWWNYQERSGLLVPTEGEVAWLFPSGRKPYWRGRVEAIRFEFAE